MAAHQYEIVGVRDLSTDNVFKVGDIVPGGPGVWRIERIEETGHSLWTGDVSTKTRHHRLICRVTES
jgi:hypothetical protein